MHEHFPDWYREVSIEPTQELLKLRTKGINKVISSINPQHALELVRLLFSLSLHEKDFCDTFCNKFRSVDSTFPLRDNKQELTILAGTTIAEIVATQNKYANLVALATVCASFLPYNSEPPIKDILSETKEYLLAISAKLRSNIKQFPSNLPNLKIEETLNKLKTNFEANPDLPLTELREPLISCLARINNAVARLTEKVNETNNSTAKTFALFSEETNILWWLFGEFSHDLDKHIADVPFPAACLVVGKELADLVDAIPGPLAANAFLDKMIQQGRSELAETISLKDAINQSPREWRENWMKNSMVDLTKSVSPIHYAVKTSLSTEGDTNWGAAYRKEVGITFSHKTKPLDFALQVYRESLLLNELQNIGVKHD